MKNKQSWNKGSISRITGILLILHMMTIACERDPDGYIEVRNQTRWCIMDVNWGGMLELGAIPAGEERGVETLLTGEEYIHLKLNYRTYRSGDRIRIDARTSATFILSDTSSLVRQ